MAELDFNQTTTTDLDSAGLDVKVDSRVVDEPGPQKENYWYNPDWATYLGYFTDVPEFKEPIRALARWTIGLGYEVEGNRNEATLERINGWGEDSFQSIMTNMIIVKKVNGDAYAEIIRSDSGELLNLKPLNPSSVRIVVNPKGLIIRYDIKNAKGEWEPFEPKDILHLCNDRIANEIHGTSALKACQWELDAKREASQNFRKILRRSSIRVIYVDTDNTTKLAQLKTEWKEGIKNGEVLILPGKKGTDMEVVDYESPTIDPFVRWIEYLDNRIYQSLGVPRAIADTSDFTEAASKVGFLTFQPVYTEEQTLLEQDLWNQLSIRIKFNRPPSLAGTLQEDEAKNTGQVGFQPNETEAAITRTE